jgi:hypothetical protein
MKKYFLLLPFLFLCALPAVASNAPNPYATHPLFLVPHKGVVTSADTLRNMRLGCTVTVKPDLALKECLELVDKLHSLVLFAGQEIRHGELVGATMTKQERDELLAAVDKKYNEIVVVKDELVKRFPYVRFYIAPEKRLAI